LNNVFSKAAIWLVIALVLFTVFKQFDNRSTSSGNSVPYSEFLDDVRNGRIKSVVISDTTGTADISAVTVDDRRIRTTGTYLDRGLVGDLVTYGVKFDVKPREEQSFLMSVFVSWFPMLLLIGVWVFFMRQMQGGGKGGAFSFGKSRARMLDENNNQITFADVAGCDEAKEEVQELVDFLRDPSRFQKLGGRIPRGVLMVGSPGTGKTLLAKAIAGEAKVPFFSISGSDFVEMFVGVGAARVRDMFENAKKQAPCIIFIDEIDAVGRQRGAGLGGGNDEREQTLNQMLVEMDGFEGNEGIINIASNNKEAIEMAVKMIKAITFVPAVGDIYDGKVQSIFPFGAFVEFNGKSGLLHISEISDKRIAKVEDVLKVGDPVRVKLIGTDPKTGKLRLSAKAIKPGE